MTRIIPSLLSALLLGAGAPAEAWQDTPPTIKALFESGRYQDIVNRPQDEAPPEDIYLVAQAHVRQQNGDAAKQTLDRLAGRGEDDPWALIARSERARIDQNLDEALSLARDAATRSQPAPDAAPQSPLAPATVYALYQLGLVQSQRQDMTGASESFERAAALAPTFAYAHYYAGMAASKLQRLDRTATHFETFLKLAPQAPERGAVESIMRTIRGR